MSQNHVSITITLVYIRLRYVELDFLPRESQAHMSLAGRKKPKIYPIFICSSESAKTYLVQFLTSSRVRESLSAQGCPSPH